MSIWVWPWTADVKQSAKVMDLLLIFKEFVSFLLTLDHMGEKTWNNISESTQQIHSQKIMRSPKEGLYQSFIKIGKIPNFGILPISFPLR